MVARLVLLYAHMANNFLTSAHLEQGGEFRERLRYGEHKFGHHELERMQGIMGDAIAHIAEKTGTKHGIGTEHVDAVMKYLKEDHADWKKLPDRQKGHIESALKEHLGIAQE